jgi:small subunit ribosomal protein S9
VSDAEHPQDEQRPDDVEAAAADVPADSAEEPADASQPAAEEPAANAPAPAAEESAPTADTPTGDTPAPTGGTPAPTGGTPAPTGGTPAPTGDTPAPAAESPQPAAPAAPATPAAPAAGTDEDEEMEVAPRQRPEIPGADLVPDLISDTDDFLDAEARAAAEAEAEAEAARAQEQDSEEEARPIADAAIDLAAGARYTATGKRKTAVARVILKPGTGAYTINGKAIEVFFPRETLQRVIRQPLETVGYESRMDVVARMHGGGVAAQAGALRHGISRALLEADPNLRGELKRRGFLTRDPRVKERKKAGLKKARKRPQFSKR